MLRVASGRSVRSSATARWSAPIWGESEPDPIPSHSLTGIEPEAVYLRRDLGRLIPVQRQHPHTELDFRGCSGEFSNRVQTASGRFVVRPQRVLPELLAVSRQLAHESSVHSSGDAQPTMR